VNTVMNLRGSIKDGNFLEYSRLLLASQGGLCSMELLAPAVFMNITLMTKKDTNQFRKEASDCIEHFL
jgi:hypothetical protein